MKTEVQLCFHEGDWRPAVGKVYQKWQEFFDPISDVIYQYQGVVNRHRTQNAHALHMSSLSFLLVT